MSNIINNLLSAETTTGTTSNISEQTTKEKPSLFDSLLGESVVKEEVGEVVSKVEGAVSGVTKEVKVEENKEENQSLETKEVESKDKVVSNTTSSLLDRLVIEAKKEEKALNKEEVLNTKIDNLLGESVVKEEVGEVVVKVENSDVLNPINSSNSFLLSDKNINSNIMPTDENLTIATNVVVSEETKNSEIVIKKDQELSLMDKLIQKSTEIVISDSIDTSIETSTKEIVVKDLISSIYLGSQKNQVNNQSLFNKNEAVNLLKDGNSIQSVKTSAEILDLGLENIEVEQIVDIEKIDIKKSNIETVDRKNLIDSILSKKNIKSEEVKNLITKSVEASNALIENSINLAEDVTVNVNSPLSYNIQSRIIGAKQQMSVMMSDIAKQMYENYKPPVTAFKINLNPLDLGSIAILMKTDKNNGLAISLSVSNNTTLETLMENQNILRNSLNKTFDENTKFNLDFSSSNQDSSNQSSNNQGNQQNNKRFEQQIDTNSILQMKEENKDKEEKAIDYM